MMFYRDAIVIVRAFLFLLPLFVSCLISGERKHSFARPDHPCMLNMLEILNVAFAWRHSS